LEYISDLLKMAIEDRIAKGKAKSIIAVTSLRDGPYKVNEVKQFGEAYGIPVLEDSAEALVVPYAVLNVVVLGILVF